MGNRGLLQGGEAELGGDRGMLVSSHFSTSATFLSSFYGHFPLTYIQLLLLLVSDYEEGTLCHPHSRFQLSPASLFLHCPLPEKVPLKLTMKAPMLTNQIVMV